MEGKTMNAKEKNYVDVKDVQEIMGISQSKAYRVIRQLNSELEANGYLTVQGRVSRNFFETRVYA